LKQIKHKSKDRTAVWLYPDTIEQMDLMLEADNAKSRSEFIEKALRFYMGYLQTEYSMDYLSKVLIDAIKGALRETENRNSSNLFRLSVEMAMMMNILAVGLEVGDDDLKKLRGRCISEVKKTRGKINMEDAIKFQQGRDD